MEANPYESPNATPGQNRPAAPPPSIGCLVLAAFPASFIAFFCTCIATGASEIGGQPPKWGLIPSFAAAATVAAVFIWAIYNARKEQRKDVK